MRLRILPLALVLVAAGFIAGCNYDESPGTPGIFSVSLSNLPVLPDSLFYEAFALFTPPTPRSSRALHEDLDPESLGKFLVDASGNLHSLSGGPANFGLANPRDLSPVNIVVTVRSSNDTTIGAFLMGGDVTGDEDEGRATLTTSFHDAFNADLRSATGTAILATPSTSAAESDSSQGIWFVSTDPRAPTLSVPALGHHWRYAAWVIHEGDTLAVGHFTEADTADSDGAGPPGQAGPDAGFSAPGSDFIVPPRNLADGATSLILTVEPANLDPGPFVGQPSPFPLSVLELAIPFGAASDSSITLIKPTSALPIGEITFTR